MGIILILEKKIIAFIQAEEMNKKLEYANITSHCFPWGMA